eukprot:264132_1
MDSSNLQFTPCSIIASSPLLLPQSNTEPTEFPDLCSEFCEEQICTDDDHKNVSHFISEATNSVESMRHENEMLKNGYKKIGKICNSLQGNIYEAQPFKSKIKTKYDRVCIKQTNKSLHRSSESIQEEGGAAMTVIVQEDIVKEA